MEGEAWLMHNNFAQAEGVMSLGTVPEADVLISIGFAKPLGGTGGYAQYFAIAPVSWTEWKTVSGSPGAPLPTQKYPLKRDPLGVLKTTRQATSDRLTEQRSPGLLTAIGLLYLSRGSAKGRYGPILPHRSADPQQICFAPTALSTIFERPLRLQFDIIQNLDLLA